MTAGTGERFRQLSDPGQPHVEALFAPYDGPVVDVAGATDDGAWIPTAYSRGPWARDSLHGGPVAALMTRAAELVDAPVPTRLARITIELLRPVSFVPVVIDVDLVRPGKKVSTLDLVMRAADDPDVVYALGRAQRIRTVDVEFPDPTVDEVPPMPDVSTLIDPWPGVGDVTFHANAVEHRFVRGHFSQQGPALDWMRMLVSVVPGEVASGWQRAAAFSDFTNGLSSIVPFDGTSIFINPDLTVHLWREPEGEWLCSDAVTRASGTGVGLSQTSLWDQHGRIGTALQSLFLDRS